MSLFDDPDADAKALAAHESFRERQARHAAETEAEKARVRASIEALREEAAAVDRPAMLAAREGGSTRWHALDAVEATTMRSYGSQTIPGRPLCGTDPFLIVYDTTKPAAGILPSFQCHRSGCEQAWPPQQQGD